MSDSRDDLTPPPRTKAGEIIDKSTKLGKLLTGLRPEQVLTVVAITSLFFVCGMYGWQSYLSDKRTNETMAMLIRSTEAREVLERHHFNAMEEKRNAAAAGLVKDIHAAHATERIARMDFESKERAKDRVEHQKWRELLTPLLKKLPEFVADKLRAAMP